LFSNALKTDTLKGKDYYEILRYLNVWTLEKRGNRQTLIEVFKMFKGFTKMDICELFTKDLNFRGRRATYIKVGKTRMY